MKDKIVKLNQDFDKIIKEGHRKSNNEFIIYFLPSSFFTFKGFKVGFSVGKKRGNAPFRNRQKRIMREIVRKNQNQLKDYHYIIIIKEAGCGKKYEDLEKSMLSLLGRIK
jgi:ribonuclease P protein component